MFKGLMAAVAIALALSAGQANATDTSILLDFNDLTSPVTSYSKNGFTVTTEDGSAFGGYLSSNGTYALYSETTAFLINWEPLDFSAPIYNVATPVGASGTVQIQILDAITHEVVNAGIGYPNPFRISAPFDNGGGTIPGRNLTLRLSGQGVFFDDVRLITSASGTPEPATWAMLLMGFFGAGGLLRRRYAAQANSLSMV